MNATRAAKITATEFHKRIKSDPKILNAHLLVHSAKNRLHLNIAGGNSISGMGNAVHPDQPVHMASVGKLFTAVLIAMLCEQGKLSFDDYIADFLDPGLLNGLHVFRGKEYTRQIQLKHLLNHTSGLHDYFEDKPTKSAVMIEQLIHESDWDYRSEEVIMDSKERCSARACIFREIVGRAGKGSRKPENL